MTPKSWGINLAAWLCPANKYVKVIDYENKSSSFPCSVVCGIGFGEKPTIVVVTCSSF